MLSGDGEILHSILGLYPLQRIGREGEFTRGVTSNMCWISVDNSLWIVLEMNLVNLASRDGRGSQLRAVLQGQVRQR